MTAIAGLVQDGTVVIGGDSAGVAGWYKLTVRADEKVFRNGPMLFGFTTSFRMGQILRFSLTVPRRHPDDDIDKWMATEFIDAVRKVLTDKAWSKKDDGQDVGGTFLVGYESRLFVIYDDFQVGEAADGFAAVGSGESEALGALHAMAGLDLSPKAKIRTALEAAERLNAAVRAPFTILEMKA